MPLAAAVAAWLLLITAVVAITPVGARWNGDLQLFFTHAGAFLQGRLSETPFLSWYPPLTLVPITLPRLLAADLPTYTFLFALEMAICAGALVLVVVRLSAGWTDGLARHTTAFVVGFIALTTVVLPWRFDVVPALLTAVALLAAVLAAPATAGALLGLATAMKLYAAVLIAPLLLWLWIRHGMASATRALVGFVVVAGIGFGLYLLFPPARPEDLLAFQGGRPLQLETLAASGVALGAILGVVARPPVTFGDFSYNLHGPAADIGLQITSVLEPILLALAVAAAASCYWRTRHNGSPTPMTLVLGMLAVLLALILGNRVFSPQYMIWLLPFVPFLPPRLRWLSVAAFALTAVIFPFLYDGLIRLEPLPVVLLAARNVLLAVLFSLVVRELLVDSGVAAVA